MHMSLFDIVGNCIALFWMSVQMICFCAIKWVYADIVGRGRGIMRYAAANGAIFALLFMLAFEGEFGLRIFWPLAPHSLLYFYPHLRWNLYFAVMLAYDSLILAYAWRIYSMYESDAPRVPARGRVLAQDCAICASVAAFYIIYHGGMIATVLQHRVYIDGVRQLQLVYTGISDFFFPIIEALCGVIIWKVYKKIRSEGNTA